MKAVLSILNEYIRQNRHEINRLALLECSIAPKDASKSISKMTNNQLGFACEAKLQEIVRMDRIIVAYRKIMIERQRAHARDHARAESAKTCPICIEQIGQNGQNTESCTTVCGHTFCTPCFLRLLNSDAQVKCPCCRLVIQEPRAPPNRWSSY